VVLDPATAVVPTVLHIDNHTLPPQAMSSQLRPNTQWAKDPVLSKHKLTGNVGEKLQSESDPKRPDVFDDRQHRPSFGGVFFLVE
jgi:hypothetical protein